MALPRGRRLRVIRRMCAVEGAITVVMVLPFVLAFLAALCALARRRHAALGLAFATIVVQVWWLVYHATDTLAITL